MSPDKWETLNNRSWTGLALTPNHQVTFNLPALQIFKRSYYKNFLCIHGMKTLWASIHWQRDGVHIAMECVIHAARPAPLAPPSARSRFRRSSGGVNPGSRSSRTGRARTSFGSNASARHDPLDPCTVARCSRCALNNEHGHLGEQLHDLQHALHLAVDAHAGVQPRRRTTWASSPASWQHAKLGLAVTGNLFARFGADEHGRQQSCRIYR